MNETTTLGLIFAAVGSVLLALLGVIWGTLKERLRAVESKAESLERQNTQQEVEIASLKQKVIAREEAHAAHREDTSAQISRVETAMRVGFSDLGGKIDRLMGRTPFPTTYGTKPDSGERR